VVDPDGNVLRFGSPIDDSVPLYAGTGCDHAARLVQSPAVIAHETVSRYLLLT